MEHDRQAADEPKQGLARERTDWAYERTVFARERTYSAWIRTGLTLVAAGLAVTRLLRTLEPRWLVYTLAGLLVGLGGAIFALSFWRYRQPLEDEDSQGRTGIPTWLIAVLTLGLLAGTGLALRLLLY